MKIRPGILCLLAWWGLGHWSVAQEVLSRAQADSALAALRGTLARDPGRTAMVTAQIAAAYKEAGDQCGLAEALGIRSGAFTELGQLDSAMACAHQVFELFPAGCDSVVLIRGYSALSHLYVRLNEFTRADSIARVGLSTWKPGWEPPSLRNALLTNQAIARANLGDLSGAEWSFRTILAHATEEGSYQDINDANTNLGAIKSMQGQTDSAIVYTRAALENARAYGKTNRMAVLFSNLAHLESTRKQHGAALALYDSAMVYAKAVKDLPLQITIHRGFYSNLAKLGRYKEAFDHALDRFELNDSLLSAEKVKALAEMQEKYESEKKAREIIGLRADMLESELQKSRVERTRNIYLLGGIGVLLAAAGLWSRLRFVNRSRAAIRREKEVSEGLLHNILPEEVAAELKQKGEAEARLIEEVTVLFTDFKGFTAMSEQLSPKELVRDIHECFSAFDRIMEKYGIEKIKTIGDAYMAAGGLPIPNTTHAVDVVSAALEIRDFIAEGKARKIAAGRPFFEIRIGIHTGPVVAGIVGVKKFAYDIWGDTVNTASRMESSGEVGEVNISEATYALVKDATLVKGVPMPIGWELADGGPAKRAGEQVHSPVTNSHSPAFTFTPRGKVQAKGKGEMTMYFVRRSSEGA